MNIGIIGAGNIGTALATLFTRTGHSVILANSRGPDSLRDKAQALGKNARAGTREEAARADLLVLSVSWAALEEATAGLPDLKGRIVIDTMNPVLQPGFRLAELDGLASSQVVAKHLPGARLVKIANTLPTALLAAEPRTPNGARVLFMSGDDAAAKGEVKGLFEDIGFAVIDLGDLATGARLQQFPGGPLPLLNLLKQ